MDGIKKAQLHWDLSEDNILTLDVEGNRAVRRLKIHELNRERMVVEELPEIPNALEREHNEIE